MRALKNITLETKKLEMEFYRDLHKLEAEFRDDRLKGKWSDQCGQNLSKFYQKNN